MKLGNFRDAHDGETIPAYFRSAVSKAGKNANVSVSDEATVQSFIAKAIQMANNDFYTLQKAYDYAVNQFEVMEQSHLRLNYQDLQAKA